MSRGLCALLCLCALGQCSATRAQSPQILLERYALAARMQDPGFAGFSAARGERFYFSRHVVPVVGEVSCASCHLKDPRRAVLRHRTKILCRACHVIDESEHPDPKGAKKRIIDAFSPVAFGKRFTDFDSTQKWFKLNCTYVLKRDCTDLEKGDLISWLLSFEQSKNDNRPDVAEEYQWQLPE